MTNDNSISPVPYASNEVRLSIRQWAVVGVIVLTSSVGVPAMWPLVETFEPEVDYRIPYQLSDDYWLWQRLIDNRIRQDRIVVIGDSVIWGEYVGPQESLSHFLNKRDGSNLFANCGVNGTHSLALEGLVRHYGSGLKNRRVILHCNLLWMESPERDLQSEKEVAFNHAALVPQILRRIPAYKATASDRLRVVVDRSSSLRRWVNHVRIAWFDSLDLHNWSIEHPYQNPFASITLELPKPSTRAHSEPISWIQRGIQQRDISWVAIETSLQWQAFQETVKVLEDRGNHVFVIVGPFNEHMLTPSSRQRFRENKQKAQQWLRLRKTPFYSPQLLPSQEYADASHPLRAGYARLAKAIYENDEFQTWMSSPQESE